MEFGSGGKCDAVSHFPFSIFRSLQCRGVIEICVSDKFGFLCVKRMISAFSSTTYDRLPHRRCGKFVPSLPTMAFNYLLPNDLMTFLSGQANAKTHCDWHCPLERSQSHEPKSDE